MRIKILAFAVLVAVFGLACGVNNAGAQSATISNRRLVGTWENSNDTLTFKADGTYSGTLFTGSSSSLKYEVATFMGTPTLIIYDPSSLERYDISPIAISADGKILFHDITDIDNETYRKR